MCHVRLIGPAVPVGVEAAAAAAVFLRLLRRAVAAAVGAVAVGAVAVGAASNGAAAVGVAVVEVVVVGVVGNLQIKKAGCRRNPFLDRRRSAVRTTPWVTAQGIRLPRQTNGAARSGPKSRGFNAHR
jgi:hypothetical protein